MKSTNATIAVVGVPGAWSTQRLVESLAACGARASVVDLAHVALDLETGALHSGDHDLCTFDAIVVKKIAPTYTPDALERVELLKWCKHRGVRVFSDPDSMYPLIDRLSGTLRLRAAGVPMPATLITEDPTLAYEFVRKHGKVIAKPLFTSKARGMTPLRAGDGLEEAVARFQAAGNQVMYLQEMLEIPGRDLGVSFVGGRYLATYARVKSGESWSTSTSSGGHYEAAHPSDAIIELARHAQAQFNLDFTCVDVVETANGPQVFEVSAFGGFRGLRDACDIDAAAVYAAHIVDVLGKS